MSMVTHSAKRKRIYRRKFDHEEAQRLHSEGMSYTQIAELMGVSMNAVRRICDEAVREEMYARSTWHLANRFRCQICGQSCSMNPNQRAANGRILCHKCRSEERQTRFRHNADGLLEIRCRICKQWKGASEFPSDRKSSRGYHRDCRECGTKQRNAHRDRRKVPCVRCGKPRTHPRDAGSQRDTGLCRACWHETRIA